MKKHYIILGLFCLLAIVACSDNDPVVEVNNGNQTEEELPPLPTEVITGSRAMWVYNNHLFVHSLYIPHQQW